VILTLHGVLLAASWTRLSDKFFSNDLNGLRRQVLILLGLGGVLVFSVGLPLAMYMGQVAKLLSGQRISELPLTLVFGWLLYISIRVWSDTFATALLSCNKISVVNKYVVWQSIISFVAQALLGANFGVEGIIFGVAISFVMTAAWRLPVSFFGISKNHI
jgi:hypothetical protein